MPCQRNWRSRREMARRTHGSTSRRPSMRRWPMVTECAFPISWGAIRCSACPNCCACEMHDGRRLEYAEGETAFWESGGPATVRVPPAPGDELNAIFRECGTDKGELHNYGAVYEVLLRGLRDRPFTLLELGTGSGGSLRAWGVVLPAGENHCFRHRPRRAAARQPADDDRDRRSQRLRRPGRFGKHCRWISSSTTAATSPARARTAYEVLSGRCLAGGRDLRRRRPAGRARPGLSSGDGSHIRRGTSPDSPRKTCSRG